jgi:hypothetical protein
MPVLGILVVVGIMLYFVLAGDKRGHGDADPPEDELFRLCLGDRQRAERLIALETKKTPGIERGEAVRRAVRSLQRDLK